MKAYILVFIGGGFGSMARYFLGSLLNQKDNPFFWGTFLANFLACVTVGVALELTKNEGVKGNEGRLLAITGFAGGFSTFSTFSAELNQLVETNNYTSAGIYGIASIISCFTGIILGRFAVRTLIN